MLLTACYASGKKLDGEEVGTENCGHVGHGAVRSMYGGGFSQFYVTFYEPYYNINYEGVENYFTEEELADLPDRYYTQREEQQIVLPNPVRPGYHFKNWRESGYDTIIGSGETKTVKDGKTIITFDFENSLRYGAGDKNLAPIFTRGCTVTFNPNGGALKDGEKAIREIDLKSVENGQFFDIGGVIPVREGYTFAGWYTSPDCTDESRIANTASDEWINAYDMQVYAKWEKNVTELTNSDTNVSISLTDGVPEDATLSADTIAQESVLESRPELKEELPGLLSIYDISVRQNGETLEIKDNPMTVKIPLNDHLKGYKYYQAVYLGDPLERFDAVVEGDFLVFETDHLSQYAILGSNTPFETSEKPTDPDELPFQDVRNGDWFYDSAKYVYDKNIMTGLDTITFGPGEQLKRAQLAVILHRMNEEPEMTYSALFPDVPDEQWFTDAILWAADAGVVTGYSNTGFFGTGDNINREQIATMMYRYARYKGYSLEDAADFSSYPDAAYVNEFAEEAMAWAVGNGIITGKENPVRLDPQGLATRAECATIIMRFMETFEKLGNCETRSQS
ncbi:S-layer homology domain-containing protein [Faecalitalea cylindroides]|uniref:S-layer homology domain-containing protein n=1 Tax=Faecalitalea cylindroides TaxID=39483 RepID=UPI00195E5609|nr:S-layer homology domain-containing protein [Faecalitalea cylindroides]MBM6811268.1 S-layer homology domain-containing protein [Faecalitalea cylindroides]